MSLSRHSLRAQVAAQAQYRCGYCLTQEVVSGIPLTLEHIIPRALGGADTEENLWLSCRLCNEAKGVQIEPPTLILKRWCHYLIREQTNGENILAGVKKALGCLAGLSQDEQRLLRSL